MSLINGLGAGLAAFGALGLKDEADQAEQARTARPLLNSTPAADAPAVGIAAAPGATAATDVPAPSSVKGVPPDLLPIYQAASKRTGIPVDVLIAQGKQESNFNPDAIGSAGEIGIHQIKPTTAADPGYGLKGIDPATLKDPAVNINFAADYLKAKAGNPNFNDPASVDAALAAYNGGGDKNYVANVRQHMAPRPSPYTAGGPMPAQDGTSFGAWQDIPTQAVRPAGAIPTPPSDYGSTTLQTPHDFYRAQQFMQQTAPNANDLSRFAPLFRVGLMNRNRT